MKPANFITRRSVVLKHSSGLNFNVLLTDYEIDRAKEGKLNTQEVGTYKPNYKFFRCNVSK